MCGSDFRTLVIVNQTEAWITAYTYPKIKAVKGGVEIIPYSEAVHLQSHLSEKQTQKHKLCSV